MHNGGQSTAETVECPKCRRVEWIEFGGEIRCDGCGNVPTACNACGKLLAGNQRFRVSDESKWHCEDHYHELLKRREYRASLDQPEAQILPRREGRTEKVQQFYEAHFREADAKHLEYQLLFLIGAREGARARGGFSGRENLTRAPPFPCQQCRLRPDLCGGVIRTSFSRQY